MSLVPCRLGTSRTAFGYALRVFGSLPVPPTVARKGSSAQRLRLPYRVHEKRPPVRFRTSSSLRVSGPFCASTASPLTRGFTCPAKFRPRPFSDPRRFTPRSTSWPYFMPQAPVGFPPFRVFPSSGSCTASPRPFPSGRSPDLRTFRRTGASRATTCPPKRARRHRVGSCQQAGSLRNDRPVCHPKVTPGSQKPSSRLCSP